jgi:ketosteroid isomerase-like protein
MVSDHNCGNATDDTNMKANMSLVLAGASALCFTLLHAAPEPSSPASPGVAVQEGIKKIEQERNEALLKHDTATLERMTSDDYTFINQRGELRTKAEILTGFKSGNFNYDAREISDLKVRVYGDMAVVTGHAKQKGVENSKDYSGENRFTRVYVKQNGRWVSVALQVTLVAK